MVYFTWVRLVKQKFIDFLSWGNAFSRKSPQETCSNSDHSRSRCWFQDWRSRRVAPPQARIGLNRCGLFHISILDGTPIWRDPVAKSRGPMYLPTFFGPSKRHTRCWPLHSVVRRGGGFSEKTKSSLDHGPMPSKGYSANSLIFRLCVEPTS